MDSIALTSPAAPAAALPNGVVARACAWIAALPGRAFGVPDDPAFVTGILPGLVDCIRCYA
jgi:hypothetical protein